MENDMIKVISFKICPFVQRVTALLEARAQPYDIEYIDLSDLPPWFRAISPNEQVPVLVTETGTALFESDAIAEYLDEIYTPIEPDLSAEQRALDRAWSYQASKHYLVQCGAMSSATRAILEDRSEKLGLAFARAERQLGDGPFFHGARFGNVDAAWLPLLHRALLVEQHSGYDFLERFPKVKAWQSSVMATGLAEKSVAADFNQVFANFYLSDQTYLGNGEDCISASEEDSSSSCCG